MSSDGYCIIAYITALFIGRGRNNIIMLPIKRFEIVLWHATILYTIYYKCT